MDTDADAKPVDYLGSADFVISSSVNSSMWKAHFEIIYRTNAKWTVDYLDRMHFVFFS